MIKIGIDPGVTGAIAALDADNRLIALHDMPTVTDGKKRRVNAPELATIIGSICTEEWKYHAYVENVHAMPGQGVTSMFNFGRSAGIIDGVLGALHIPLTHVTPQKWKKAAGLIGKEKDQGRTRAIELYPSAPLSRKKDIGRADAILISRFGL